MDIVEGFIAEFNWIAQNGIDELNQFPGFMEFVWEETTEDVTTNDIYVLWPIWVRENAPLLSRLNARLRR